VTGYTVNDGNGGANYAVSTVNNATGVINQAALTITASTNTKTYDSTTSAAATPTVSGLQGGDSVTGLSQVYSNANAGTGKTLSVAGYTVNDGNGGANYAVSTANNTTGVINQAPLTVTASTDAKTYDATTGSAATPTVLGLQGADSVTGLSQAFANKNAGTGKTLQVTGYTVNDGNSGGNYAVSTVNDTTGVINQRSITVTATGVNKVYDATTAATVSYADNRIAGDTLSVSGSATFADPNTAVAKPVSVVAISLSGPDAANYSLTSGVASTSANITAAPLTISANNAVRVYGFANPTFSASYSGLKGSDTPASATSGPVTFSTPAVASSPVGPYAINAYGTTSLNYSISYAPGVLLVVPVSVSLPDPLSTAYGQMNVLPPQGGAMALPGVKPVVLAEGEFESSRFLQSMPQTVRVVMRGEAFSAPCVSATSIGVLNCVSFR